MRVQLAAALMVSAACGAAPAQTVANARVPSSASQKDCENLLEHVVDLTWLAQPTTFHFDAYGEDRHEFKKQLRSERGSRFLELCGAVSSARVECAQVAAELDAVRSCDPRLVLAD